MPLRRFSLVLAVIGTSVTMISCGSGVNGQPAAGEIDVRTLDVGAYSTLPLDLRYEYSNRLDSGRQLAVMRLADQVVIGPDIDPVLKYGHGGVGLLSTEAATNVLADAAGPVLDKYQMMFGFSAGSGSAASKKEDPDAGDTTKLTLAVLQFPDAESARNAAPELDAADFDLAREENRSVSLPKYPDAHSHWRPGIPTLGSTMAHGQYVVTLFVHTPTADINQLTDLAQKAYATQTRLLDGLAPLSLEGVLRLPYDPDGMLRRTFNADGIGSPSVGSQAAFTSQGFLHFIDNQEKWKLIATDIGLDRFARTDSPNSSLLFRVRDSAAAARLLPELLETTYPVSRDVPRGIPGARCGESNTSDDYQKARFRCVVQYRQYVAAVHSSQLIDAQQRAAAQYAVLANSQ